MIAERENKETERDREREREREIERVWGYTDRGGGGVNEWVIRMINLVYGI